MFNIMVMNKDISSILLLVVIGFVIYCLSNNENNKPKKEVEITTESSIQQPITSPDSIKETFANQEPSPVSSNNLSELSENIPVSSDVVDSDAQEIVKKAADESCNYKIESRQPAGSGTALDQAFQVPVGKNESKDKVDMTRNNVKNYNSKDYLPKATNKNWFETDFASAKYKIDDANLINTNRYSVGVNTVGQSLKNGGHDLRGTIPNPKFTVSPWNNSTIEPDYNIKPLC